MSEFAALRARLERAGLDADSAAWMLKAMSPATPTGSGLQIPDSSAVPTANPEFINEFTISAQNSSASWDLLVIKTPTYPFLGYAVSGPAGTDFTTGWATTGMAMKVLQAEPGGAAVIDQQSATQLAGTTFTTGILLDSILPSTQPVMWRATARSCTEYLVASDQTNQGTVTSGQYVPRIQPFNPGTVHGLPTGGGRGAMYSIEMMEVPLSEATMTAMNPRVRIAPAKQGVYQPIYNYGPTFQWARGRDWPAVAQDYSFNTNAILYYPLRGATSTNPAVAGCIPSIMCASDPTSAVLVNDWLGAGSVLSTAGGLVQSGNPYTWGWDNEMVGVSIYRGLSGSASVTLKMVTAIELAPAPTSPIRQFVKPAANNDPRALQLYYDLVHDMPHTYPASSNFLGAVLSAIGGLLPTVLPHVSGIIQSARGVFGRVPNEERGRGETQPEMAVSSTSRPMVRMGRTVTIPRRSVSVSSKASRASRTSRGSSRPAKNKKKKRSR